MYTKARYKTYSIFCDINDIKFMICLNESNEIEYTMMTLELRTTVSPAVSNHNSNSIDLGSLNIFYLYSLLINYTPQKLTSKIKLLKLTK